MLSDMAYITGYGYCPTCEKIAQTNAHTVAEKPYDSDRQREFYQQQIHSCHKCHTANKMDKNQRNINVETKQ